MIKSHPPEKMLQYYIAGELNSASALLVAAHLDMCAHCRLLAHDIETQQAAAMFRDSAIPATTNLQQMLNAILESEKPPATAEPATDNDALIFLEGQGFRLPPTLARQKSRIGGWHKMPGNLWRAPLALGTEEKVNLIYMAAHSSVPEHTHKGTEQQLVIHGNFHDKYGSYSDGDLILLDNQHCHHPYTTEQDCLVLVILDAPLHFTSGISRLLNPFSSLFFR